jgi:hypothetical protein
MLCAAASAGAQTESALPFRPGERLIFLGRARAGVSARATMSVDGPTVLRGVATWVLSSSIDARLGPLRASDRSSSWLDPLTLSALRYSSRERRPFGGHEEDVEIDASERRWVGARGDGGVLETHMPLDELSFLYFVRTLPHVADTAITVPRHFDAARNPVLIRVIGHERIDVPAGQFRALVVEMRVRDRRRYDGTGVIRLHLSDDPCRLLLRIESQVPGQGLATLSLASYEGASTDCTARLR